MGSSEDLKGHAHFFFPLVRSGHLRKTVENNGELEGRYMASVELTSSSTVEDSKPCPQDQVKVPVFTTAIRRLPLRTNDMVSYVENPEESTHAKINKFSKVAGHKINTQKLILPLHINSEQNGKFLNNSFATASKRRKYCTEGQT